MCLELFTTTFSCPSPPKQASLHTHAPHSHTARTRTASFLPLPTQRHAVDLHVVDNLALRYRWGNQRSRPNSQHQIRPHVPLAKINYVLLLLLLRERERGGEREREREGERERVYITFTVMLIFEMYVVDVWLLVTQNVTLLLTTANTPQPQKNLLRYYLFFFCMIRDVYNMYVCVLWRERGGGE